MALSVLVFFVRVDREPAIRSSNLKRLLVDTKRLQQRIWRNSLKIDNRPSFYCQWSVQKQRLRMNRLRCSCKGEHIRWRRCSDEFSGDGYGYRRTFRWEWQLQRGTTVPAKQTNTLTLKSMFAQSLGLSLWVCIRWLCTWCCRGATLI